MPQTIHGYGHNLLDRRHFGPVLHNVDFSHSGVYLCNNDCKINTEFHSHLSKLFRSSAVLLQTREAVWHMALLQTAISTGKDDIKLLVDTTMSPETGNANL